MRALARATGPALVAAMFLALALAWSLSLPPGVFGIGFEGARRDAFPVFNEPAMLGAAEAEAAGVIFPRDAVIGVSLGGEAKAYPIAIMGFHELGNDTLGGVPIAISW